MKVDYTNVEQKKDVAQVTFIGYVPSTGKRKRAVVELNSGDLVTLVNIARQFEDHQRRIANVHVDRANAVRAALQK